MKRFVLVLLLGIAMTGCDEKLQYEQAVMEQMKMDKDIKDYGIDPAEMTECVVSKSSHAMPGFAPFDPIRKQAYVNYQKMLELNRSSDPKKTLDELREAFGSAKGLADAHGYYSEAVMECMSGIITGKEKGQDVAPAPQ